jgi:2'-5' RNA ligase
MDDPRVLWAGIEPSDKLNQLFTRLKSGLVELNLKTEDRPFRPHLTLGRIRRMTPGNAMKDLINRFKDSFLQPVHVDEIILYESILNREGAVYKTLGKFRL